MYSLQKKENRRAFIFFAITALLASMPCIASAHPYDVYNFVDNTNGVVTYIEKGVPAPFTGTLMDATATARFIAINQLQNDKCQIDVDKEVAITNAKLQLKIDQTNASLIAANKRYELQRKFDDERVKILTEEISKMEYIATRNSGRFNPLYFSGGVVAGALVTIALTFAVSSSGI